MVFCRINLLVSHVSSAFIQLCGIIYTVVIAVCMCVVKLVQVLAFYFYLHIFEPIDQNAWYSRISPLFLMYPIVATQALFIAFLNNSNALEMMQCSRQCLRQYMEHCVFLYQARELYSVTSTELGG